MVGVCFLKGSADEELVVNEIPDLWMAVAGDGWG